VERRPWAIDEPAWVLAVAGTVNVLFGLACLFWVGIPFEVFTPLVGAYLAIWSIAELAAAYGAARYRRPWWIYLMLGLVNGVAALLVFFWSGLSISILLSIVGYWALVFGVFEIIATFTSGSMPRVLVGLIAILFGLGILTNVAAGVHNLAAVIGLFALVEGIIMLIATTLGEATTRQA
jgi:uncharacterized membrane protein HdeD (DUF308 family)